MSCSALPGNAGRGLALMLATTALTWASVGYGKSSPAGATAATAARLATGETEVEPAQPLQKQAASPGAAKHIKVRAVASAPAQNFPGVFPTSSDKAEPAAPTGEVSPAPSAAPPAPGGAEHEHGTTPAPDRLPPALALPPPPPPAAPAMQPGPTRAIDPAQNAAVEVTVVGTRVARTAGSAHVIKAKQLERFEYDDAHAVLNAVPGVYTRGEDGVGLRPNIGLRGVNPDRSKKVTIMEDGILVGPAPYSAPAAYYFPLITRMTQLRVIKGPGAISFGPQTVAGAIDMTTRLVPPLQAGGIDVAFGEYGYSKAHGHFGWGDSKLGYLIEGIHLRNSGFKDLPDGADTGFVKNEWMFKTYYRFDPTPSKNELQFKFSYSDEDSHETYLGLSETDFRNHPLARYPGSAQDRMRNHRIALALTHDYELSPNASIKTTLYRHDFLRIWRKVNGFRGADIFSVLSNDTDPRNALFRDLLAGVGESSSPGETLFIGPNQRDFLSQGVDSRLRWQVATGPLAHRIEAGLRLHYDRIDRLHTQDGFLLLRGRIVPEGTPTQTTANNEAWTMATAFHIVDAVTWKSITLTPGIRMEILRSALNDRIANTEGRRWDVVALPGVGAYAGLSEHFGLLAGVYRGFSPPEPGSPATTSPELSINYEGGARYVSGRFRAEVIGYFNDYSNLTDVCTLSSGCTQNNLDRQFDAGNAHIYGLESFIEHEIAVGKRLRAPVMVAYTLTKTEFLNDFNSLDPIFGNVRAGDEIPYVPRHQLSVTLGLENGRAGAALVGTYVSAMREQAGSQPVGVAGQAISTDEQFILDASASVRIAGTFSVYLNLRNLLDGHFIMARRPFGARPNAPRWIQAGIKATF